MGPIALKVLTGLGAGNPACSVVDQVPCAKSTVNYWKNKFLANGALRLKTPGIVKYYDLTPFGSKLITRSEGGVVGEVVALEDFAVKFGVVEWEKCRIDWEKLGEPRNWEKFGFRVGRVRVVKTSRSIIVHPGPLRGFDVDELEVCAGQIIERVRSVLENRFGMVLSEECLPLHKPVYRFYSEEAKEDVKHGTAIVEGPDGTQSSIDSSPPEHVPHEEYYGKERAVARQLLPDSVYRLRLEIASLKSTIAGLIEAVKPVGELTKPLGELTTTLQKFMSVEEKGTIPSQKSLPEYVS